MTSISIGPYLRWKLKNLGFEYDPVEDTWFWGDGRRKSVSTSIGPLAYSPGALRW